MSIQYCGACNEVLKTADGCIICISQRKCQYYPFKGVFDYFSFGLCHIMDEFSYLYIDKNVYDLFLKTICYCTVM